jgi:hypothetical protein
LFECRWPRETTRRLSEAAHRRKVTTPQTPVIVRAKAAPNPGLTLVGE